MKTFKEFLEAKEAKEEEKNIKQQEEETTTTPEPAKEEPETPEDLDAVGKELYTLASEDKAFEVKDGEELDINAAIDTAMKNAEDAYKSKHGSTSIPDDILTNVKNVLAKIKEEK